MKEKINKIIKFCKTKKGKAILFFTFYLFFFIFLFKYINYLGLDDNSSNNQNSTNNNDHNISESTNYYETKKLENSDYQYKITISSNLDNLLFRGSKSNNEDLKNYDYSYLIDLFEVKRIIKNAKYLSKEVDTNNTYKVKYEIKNKDLGELFDKDFSSEEINNITLIVKENNDLIKLELDYSNYLKLIDNNINYYKVLIEYEY